MSSLANQILEIYNKMWKVYEAGQLASVNLQSLIEKAETIPLVDGDTKALSVWSTLRYSLVDGSGTVASDGGYQAEQFAVTEYKKYIVSGSASAQRTTTQTPLCPLIVFTDVDNRTVGYEIGTESSVIEYVSNYEVIAPEGAKYMIVNHLTTHEAVSVLEVAFKFEVDLKHLSDTVQTLLASKGINTDYIWYANIDAVAKRSSPLIKLGGIEDYKIQNSMYTVLAASGIIGSLITMDLSASTVDAIVSAGNFSKFHNGDLLMYAGSYLERDVWRWIPQAEAKEDRDGWESAWDKQQVNKVPGIESLLATMPKEITFHTEAGLLNWISKDGIHYVKAQTGNSANPVSDTSKLSYIVYVGREFDGTNFTGKRFQMAHHLATNRYFYRIGAVASGGSFNGIAWAEITT